jgi:hypothetical protein
MLSRAIRFSPSVGDLEYAGLKLWPPDLSSSSSPVPGPSERAAEGCRGVSAVVYS